MKIASLFIDLGIDAASAKKTQETLQGVRGGMAEVRSEGLAAKAAIIGTVYALEQLMSASMKHGLGLQQYADYTGDATETMQRFQVSLLQAGTQAEETKANLESMYKTMNTSLLMGNSSPAFAALMSKSGIDMNQAKNANGSVNMPYVMEKVFDYFRNEKDIGIRNWIAEGVGISPNVVKGMATTPMTPDKVPNSMLLSQGEIGSNAKVNIMWQNLWANTERKMSRFVAKHGQQLTHDVDLIVDSLIKLSDAILNLAEKTGFFETLGNIISVASGGISTTATFFGGSDKSKENLSSKILKEMGSKDTRPLIEKWFNEKNIPVNNGNKQAPSININIEHHGDAKDTQAVKDAHASAARTIYSQLSRGQVA